jgi:hypothetical protein
MHRTQIPPLSPFPELHFTITKMDENFDMSLKPRTSVSERPVRRLNFAPATQLKELRTALDRDLSDFANRMQRLGTAQPLQMDTLQFPERSVATQPVQKAKKRISGQRKLQPLPPIAPG